MPTLHKGFNNLLEKEEIISGNVFSSIQSSFFVRHIDKLECNGIEFKKGELYQRDFNILEECMKISFRSDSLIQDVFYQRLFELCTHSDTCVYIFRSSPTSSAIAIAISNPDGLQSFFELKKDVKSNSVISYIKNTLNEKGWF